MVARAYFSQFDDWSGASVRDSFGANGLDTAVLPPSKALKDTAIALERK